MLAELLDLDAETIAGLYRRSVLRHDEQTTRPS